MKPRQLPVLPHTLRMVAWEVTRSCNLACVHCRASSVHGPYEGELTTAQGLSLLDHIAAFSKPVIILTGGEPLLRADIYEIAAYGSKKGLRMVLATNGTLVTEEIARKMMDAGIQRVSISIDGMDAKSHDAFRNVPGAFTGALTGIEALKKAGLEFQINTTITKANLNQLEGIMDLAVNLGAAAHHIFLLVPTGRGKEMAEQAISPGDYEKTLNWFYETSLHCPIQLKATCAPHYYRIYHQKEKGKGNRAKGPGKAGAESPFHAMTRGCLGGISFCFISHTGQVQPCGYLELDCGRIKEQGFEDIWNNSPIFKALRDLNHYKGKCGRCEFIKVCGGCRARAYEITGDYLAEEPFCIYEPGKRGQATFSGETMKKSSLSPFLDTIDKKILNIIQKDFTIVAEPFKVIAEKVGITEDEVLERISRLKQEGIIRRIGAVFDSKKMGFVSTLCAARVPEDSLKVFVEVVNSYTGVTHNYRRNHEYNVWFTFIAPDKETLEKSLAEIRDRTGVSDVISMPAVRTFKIDASFEL